MARPKAPTPNRKDNRFEVKVTDGRAFDGTLKRKSFYSTKSLADAKRRADEYRAQKAAATLAGISFVGGSCPFDEFATKWLNTYKKPFVDENTFRTTYHGIVVGHLIPYFGSQPMDRIYAIDIQNLYAQYENSSHSLISKIKLCLRGIFDAGIENHVCSTNPAKSKLVSAQMGKVGEKDVYSQEEIEQVEKYFMCSFPDIVLLLNTGMRRGELLGCRRSDISLKNRSLNVQRSIADVAGGDRVKVNSPKWKSYRTIPLNDMAIRAIMHIPNNGEILLPTKEGKYQSPNSWSRKFHRHMKQMHEDIGVKILHPHELRHTYGTELRRRNIDIYTIQKILGHKDVNLTAGTYVKNEFDILQTSVDTAFNDTGFTIA